MEMVFPNLIYPDSKLATQPGVGGFETAVAILNEVVAYSFLGKKTWVPDTMLRIYKQSKKVHKAGLFHILFGLITFYIHQCYGSAV